MTTAFEYRRRAGQAADLNVALVGSDITFEENVEYVLYFPAPCSQKIARQIGTIGGDLIASDVAVLSFDNFVGQTELCGVNISVISTKLGSGGVSRVLQEISEFASSLIFGWSSPTGFSAIPSTTTNAPVPYHQLQFLRRSMLQEKPGRRLQDWLAAIERNPTRRFEPERPVVSPDRVRRLDSRALQSIFTRVERLQTVPAYAPIASNRLAQALSFGTPSEPHFPAKVAAPRGRLSFDTPENRFVRHVLGECLAIVYRFVDHPKLHAAFREECRTLSSILEQVVTAPFISEAGRLSSFQGPTQALAKADGYREVFSFWTDLIRHVSLPRTGAETARLLEGRDMATLYEYWVFLQIVKAISTVTGVPLSDRPAIRRNEFGESLVLGFGSGAGSNVRVEFNPTFTRSNETAYSTPLRPDVIVTVGSTHHAFDAKYRLNYFDTNEDDPDDAATYKRADLYKMHTYRDAIQNLKSAFVVYPGTEFVFFQRTGAKTNAAEAIAQLDGVGALPLRPAHEGSSPMLVELMQKIIIQPQQQM